MKIRLAFLDDDDEYDAPNVYDRPPWGSEDARSSMDPFDSRFGPRGKPRLRAPSDDGDTSGSSDVGSDFGGDDNRDSMTFGLSQPAETVPTLSAVSRQDLLRRVEKSCEKRALDAVTSSMAYMSLCGTLKSAHADAERQLDMQSQRTDDASLASLFQRHVDNEVRAKRQLDQLHHNERKAFDQVQKTLEKYQKEQEDRTRAEYEELEREAQARRMADEARREAQRRKEEAASAAAAERREQEEQERTQQDEAAREAAEREAKKKQEEDEQKKQAEARSAMQKASSEYITAGHARIARLETMQAISKEISEMTDPTVKRMRVDIKKMAGACNQISASPSSIRAVVDKIQALLTMARNYDEKVFKFALDIVAGNLAKQARVILDYKACYPLAHVISMSCVRTPELTDVLLGYFNQMCLYTIPQFLKKTQSQSLRDYQLSIGFEVAVGKEGEHGEPELEHVTEYTKRMTMLSAVLAAAMQTKPWDGSPQPAGLGIGDCWIWVARIANDEPDLLTGSLLLTILEVASFELSQTYKQQFHKLLVLIARQVGPRLSKNARTGAANAAGQLEMFITEYEQRGCKIIEPPARKLEESKISQADEEKTDGDKGGGYRGGGGGGYGGGGGGYGGGGRGGGGRAGGGRGGGRGRGRGGYY